MKQLLFFEPFDDVVITQPNQAFTPRQIIEQFARNEVIPTMNQPSDTIDDSTVSEDDMLNNVIEFEDAIEAENHLIENQYALQHEADEGKQAAGTGSTEAPAEASEGSES